MAIKQTQVRNTGAGGWKPDEDPAIARALVDAWTDAYVDEGSDALTMPKGIYLRASDAGACARALGYRIRRRMELDSAVPLSNPPTVADRYRMNIGTLIHDEMGRHLKAAFPGAAEVEVLCIRTDEPGISMHIDAVISWPDGRKTVVEVKTINGMGYKRAMGAAKQGDPAQGPRWNAVVQGALAALEQDADELVVIVFALELVSKSVAQRYNVDQLGSMVAQWTLYREEFEPIAVRERARMLACLHLVQGKDVLPPRCIPDRELPPNNRITDPRNGSWVVLQEDGTPMNLGNTWHCDYCWDRDNCVKDGET